MVPRLPAGARPSPVSPYWRRAVPPSALTLRDSQTNTRPATQSTHISNLGDLVLRRRWLLIAALPLLLLGLGACGSTTMLFKAELTHYDPSPASGCNPDAIVVTAESNTHDVAGQLLALVDGCLRPRPMEIAWCSYYKGYAASRKADQTPDMAHREAFEKSMQDPFDEYADRVNQLVRGIRGKIDEARRFSPQNSLLYMLEARLYLKAGMILEHPEPLLRAYAREQAVQLYRRVPDLAQQSLSINPGYGLAHIYHAESLARMRRCEDATALLGKLHASGYETSSSQAILAHCALVQGDKDAFNTAIGVSIERANREASSGWANDMRRYVLRRRSDWMERQRANRGKRSIVVEGGLALDEDTDLRQYKSYVIECLAKGCRAGGRNACKLNASGKMSSSVVDMPLIADGGLR